MFGNLLQIIRARVGSKALVGGIAAAVLVTLAGGWAFAGHGPGHVTASLKSAFHAAGLAGGDVSRNSPQAGTQAGTPQTTQPQGSVAQAGTKMPAGLILATPQGLAELSIRGDAGASEHSATGGGSAAQFFHFGFTAQSHRNGNVAGSVTGNAEVVFVGPNGGPLHIDVNCLEIVGNDAYMSGVLAKSAFDIAKGAEMFFGVQDDDSASKADLISDIFFLPAPTLTCHKFQPKPHYAVQGNIEIH